jgi:hypothetical protein
LPTEAIVALSTLGGVVVGSALTALFQLWRRVLDAQSAARVIRMETAENRAKVGLALRGLKGDPPQDAAWLELRITLAPVLGEEELSDLYRDCSLVGQSRLLLDDLGKPGRAGAQANQHFRDWHKALRERAKLLRTIECSSRWKLLWRLLFPKKLDPTSMVSEEGEEDGAAKDEDGGKP